MRDCPDIQPDQGISVDTKGWDTVSAIRIDTLNAAIADAGTSPPGFDEPAEGAMVSARFRPWMISPESDGRLLTMKLPLHDITITKPDGARCFDRGHAMIDVHLDLLPHEASDNGQVTTCLLVVDLEPQGGDDTAARLTDLRIEGHHSIEDAAYLRLALGTWLNANLDAFTHVFATVNIHKAVTDQEDFKWLKPSRVGYAFGYDQKDPEQSIMAVLCRTDGRAEAGLPYQVAPEALPEGLTVSYLISRQLFMKDMLKGAVVRSFDGLESSDLTFAFDDTVMRTTRHVPLKDVEYEGKTYDMTLETFELTLRETDFRVETNAASKVFPGIWSVSHTEAAYGIRMITGRAGQKTLGFIETEEMLAQKTQRVAAGVNVLEWMLIIIFAICIIILNAATFGTGSIIPTVLAGLLIGCGIGSLTIEIIEAVNDGDGPAIDMLVLNATEAIAWSTGSKFVPTEAGLRGAMSIAGTFETGKTANAEAPARLFQKRFAATMAARRRKAA